MPIGGGIGGTFEYADLGDAEINSNKLIGSYKNNNLFAFIINFNWKF